MICPHVLTFAYILLKGVEYIVDKGEIAQYKQFLFFATIFSESCRLQMSQNVSACEKGSIDLYCFFQGPSYYPMSHPPLPTDEITEHPTLYKIVLDLAIILDCRSLFAEPGDGEIHVAT